MACKLINIRCTLLLTWSSSEQQQQQEQTTCQQKLITINFKLILLESRRLAVRARTSAGVAKETTNQQLTMSQGIADDPGLSLFELLLKYKLTN